MEWRMGGGGAREPQRDRTRKRSELSRNFHRITHPSNGKQQSTAAPLIRRKQLVWGGQGQRAAADSLHAQSTGTTNPNQWRCFNGQKKQREQYTSLTSGGGGGGCLGWGWGWGVISCIYILQKKKNETEGKLS